MPQRDAQRTQMMDDLVAVNELYGGVTAEMLDHAAAGTLTLEMLADYEDCHGLVSGLLSVRSPYSHPSFLCDGRIALEEDPSLDTVRRERALSFYSRWSRSQS